MRTRASFCALLPPIDVIVDGSCVGCTHSKACRGCVYPMEAKQGLCGVVGLTFRHECTVNLLCSMWSMWYVVQLIVFVTKLGDRCHQQICISVYLFLDDVLCSNYLYTLCEFFQHLLCVDSLENVSSKNNYYSQNPDQIFIRLCEASR